MNGNLKSKIRFPFCQRPLFYPINGVCERGYVSRWQQQEEPCKTNMPWLVVELVVCSPYPTTHSCTTPHFVLKKPREGFSPENRKEKKEVVPMPEQHKL